METVNAVVKTFDTTVSSTLQRIEQPTIVRAVVTFFLILYAARIAPAPPQVILDLFENFYFRLFIFTLILWTAQLSPSTAILIALCFLVTINYAKSGKFFESLENVQATPDQSVNAIVALAQAASTPNVADATVVKKVAEIAVSNVTTQEGTDAVKALAEQAVTPVAGVPAKVDAAVQQAVQSIPVPVVQVTPDQSVNAVVALAQAASTPNVADPNLVTKVANIAVSNVTTQQGADAVKALAEQAVTPVAGVPEKVEAAVQQAVQSIPGAVEAVKSVETGCYPVRNYDMKQVQPNIEGQVSFEDLAPFEL